MKNNRVGMKDAYGSAKGLMLDSGDKVYSASRSMRGTRPRYIAQRVMCVK